MSENVAENNSRIASYKNASKSTTEMRQRRHDVTVELRKNKKDDQLFKRRNIDPEELLTSPLQENNGQSPATLKLDDIVAFIKSGNQQKEFAAVQAARKMLSRERNPPIDTMIGLGLVPICVQLLENFENTLLQFEAAWALTNIASGSSDQTKAVVEADAVPRFIALLSSPSVNVAEQAVWALGNIAGDGPKARDIVLCHNIVESIIQLVRNPNTPLSFLRNIVWLMSNLCRNKTPPPPFDRVQPLIQLLSDLLSHNDSQVLADACWALSYVTDDDAVKIESVVAANAVPRLVHLLDCDDPAIITPALRSVGNIVTGNDTQTDVVIASGALGLLGKLLQNKKHNIIKEAAWTVSNITAGNQGQIQHVFDSGILAYVIQVLEKGDFKSQKEAAWVITNITTGGSTEQIVNFIEKYSVMKPYCDLLESKDNRTVRVVLTGITNIFLIADKIGGTENLSTLFEQIGGLDKLEALQNHENEEVYKKSYDLIEAYFTDADEKENQCGPKEVNGAFEFNPSTDENGYSF